MFKVIRFNLQQFNDGGQGGDGGAGGGDQTPPAKPTADHLKEFAKSEEGKAALQPVLDSYFTKGLDTWKANNLESLVEERYNELHPPETEADKRIRNLEKKLEEKERAEKRSLLFEKALEEAKGKTVPSDLIGFLLDPEYDESATVANIEKANEVIEAEVQRRVNERFKDSGYKPGQDKSGGTKKAVGGLKAIAAQKSIRQD